MPEEKPSRWRAFVKWLDFKRKGKSFWSFLFINKTFLLFILGFIIGLLFAFYYFYIIVGFIALLIGILADRLSIYIDKKLENSTSIDNCVICGQVQRYKESKLCHSCLEVQKQVE